MTRLWGVAATIACTAACTACEVQPLPAENPPAGNGNGGVGNNTCLPCSAPQNVGMLGDPRLTEASGLALSRKNPGALWTHNDSGDGAFLYALVQPGQLGVRFLIEGITAIDWEDLDIGICPDNANEDCLYIADIGDNARARPKVQVHVIREPDLSNDQIGEDLTLEVLETRDFTWPDGAQDCEALAVAPDGTLLFIPKTGSTPVWLHSLAPGEGVTNTAVLTTTLELGDNPLLTLVTAADHHPTRNSLIARGYFQAFEILLDSAQICPEARLTDPQGEAISWLIDGQGWVTVSEGAASPMFGAQCASTQ